MNLSPYEIGMLLCFGISWPISIYNLYKTKRTEGKSLIFAGVLLLGYAFGVLHKVNYQPKDPVVWLYIMNATFVIIDICMTIYYRRKA